MSTCCVVVANRARARFFTVEDAEIDEVDRSPWLLERENLANSDFDLAAEVMLNFEPLSLRQGSTGSDESNSRFVRQITSVTAAFVKRNSLRRVALVAAPDFLDLLRERADELIPKIIERVELQKDLCCHTLSQIQATLTLHGILPSAPPGNLEDLGALPSGYESRSNPI